MEGAAGEAGPTGAAGDEADVESKQEWEEVVSYCDGDGSANKTPFELLVSVSADQWKWFGHI